MHRIERIELDLPDGTLPSLSQRFSAKTGLDPAVLLGSAGANGQIAGTRSAVHAAGERG
jgi:predicted sulfurtransferase